MTDTTANPGAETPLEAAVVDAPIAVDNSATKALLGTAGGALMIVIGGWGTFIGFFKAHDVAAMFNWFHQTDGAKFASAALLLGGLAWRLTASFRKHVKLRIAAAHAPNWIAFIKGVQKPAVPFPPVPLVPSQPVPGVYDPTQGK